MNEMLPFGRRGHNVTIYPMAKIVQPEKISIGNHVIIDDFCLIVGGKEICIGDYVHIASFCSVTGGGTFIMENFSGLSAGVRIITGNEDYWGGCLTNPTVPFPHRRAERSFVHIKKHALIGTNVVIMPGVTIGEGAVVGACSLVRNDIPPWEVHAGIPAEKIADRPNAIILREEMTLREAEGIH